MKSEFYLKPIIKGVLKIFNDSDNIHPESGVDINKWKPYPKLIREFSNILSTAGNALDSLRI